MTYAFRTSELEFEPIARLPQRAALKVVSVPATKPALLPATCVHPAAFAIPLASVVWFAGVAWASFAGGETSLVLAVVTFFFLMFFGLFVGLAALGRDMTPECEHSRSFGAFLKGEVEIATGRISGKEALLQICRNAGGALRRSDTHGIDCRRRLSRRHSHQDARMSERFCHRPLAHSCERRPEHRVFEGEAASSRRPMLQAKELALKRMRPGKCHDDDRSSRS